ncbi:hypothetical protein HanIR_Chr04g0207141 [Helianthus annuus]|nr:hypothetical protein HanIR_Chr04g0207141 [Helianthus annuus]
MRNQKLWSVSKTSRKRWIKSNSPSDVQEHIKLASLLSFNNKCEKKNRINTPLARTGL